MEFSVNNFLYVTKKGGFDVRNAVPVKQNGGEKD